MLDQLRHHRDTLTELLQSQCEVSFDDMGPDMRISWQIYKLILDDAIAMLNSLIEYLSYPKEKIARK